MSDTMLRVERDPAEPSRRPIIRRAIAIVVLLAVLAVGGYLLWPQGAQPAAAAPRPKLTVTMVTPKRVTMPQRLTASGVIAPWQEASIGTQIGSYQLIDVRVNVGDQVRRGEVLARLNPALLRAEEAQLLARHEQAVANDRRAKALQANGAISELEVLQFATEARTASALLAAKRLELRYTSVLAPDDGVITARTATLGAVVPSGQELFRLIRQNRLEWRGELTAPQLNAVVEGQRIALVLPDGSKASAVVRQTAPALDAGSRLALVYADLVPGSRARAGMFVTGEIAFGASPALAVPAECIVIRDGRSYVMQVAGTAAVPQVVLRGVTTGRRHGETVEILQGLGGSEQLVLKGAGFLSDGDVVRVAGAREARP
jgi:RND family efflux transporter MFP subunit